MSNESIIISGRIVHLGIFETFEQYKSGAVLPIQPPRIIYEPLRRTLSAFKRSYTIRDDGNLGSISGQTPKDIGTGFILEEIFNIYNGQPWLRDSCLELPDRLELPLHIQGFAKETAIVRLGDTLIIKRLHEEYQQEPPHRIPTIGAIYPRVF